MPEAFAKQFYFALLAKIKIFVRILQTSIKDACWQIYDLSRQMKHLLATEKQLSRLKRKHRILSVVIIAIQRLKNILICSNRETNIISHCYMSRQS
jgi:hypothetical protein